MVEFAPEQPPHPVEYKRGFTSFHRANEIQLCGQALCLEEMFDCTINKGSIYYYKLRRRHEIDLNERLRVETKRVIEDTRQLLESQHVPEPVADKRCKRCSLKQSCLPFVPRKKVKPVG